MDVVNADHTKFGVESANSVLERTTKFIIELDDGILSENGNAGSGGERWICVLVAHGDVLQIAQTGFLPQNVDTSFSVKEATSLFRTLALHHSTMTDKNTSSDSYVGAVRCFCINSPYHHD